MVARGVGGIAPLGTLAELGVDLGLLARDEEDRGVVLLVVLLVVWPVGIVVIVASDPSLVDVRVQLDAAALDGASVQLDVQVAERQRLTNIVVGVMGVRKVTLNLTLSASKANMVRVAVYSALS